MKREHLAPLMRQLLDAGLTVRIVVRGSSMEPLIADGDALHVVAVKPAAIRRGDVVVTEQRRGLTAHRVVQVYGSEGDMVLVTRGDAAESRDDHVLTGQLLGKVVAIDRNETLFAVKTADGTILQLQRFLVRSASVLYSLRLRGIRGGLLRVMCAWRES